MTFTKMLSMASAAISLVLVVVMLDSAVPEVFIRVVLIVMMMGLTGFLGYRLKLAFDRVQRQGQQNPVPQKKLNAIYALCVVFLIICGTTLYLIFNPVWNTSVMFGASLTVFLVFLVSRLVLHIDILPLLGIDEDEL